ncbi:hypothetical protein A2W14_06170 [Candidatus Gottesmanbacteria bacterium RBG_16_37_8]|uniref:ATP-grasp domain-containing protein n=1 Tax=Candidatus Gottesmanbacteria bacterium RBG_16_37_8 TaxID=1798371 RepID=A0A1F5YRV0_9BACT|nr:MAG: hypothetical protein A2W14_06170 [Candidatus Gottesmanbacteria bacterium RBG_16_37_8]
MNLAFCFNIKHTNPSKNLSAQKEADFDSPFVINSIFSALKSGGHQVLKIEADNQAYFSFFKNSKKLDIVFNIAECFRGESREAQIPNILEMLNIPFTHSGPLTHSISLDKTLTKIVLSHYGIPTPKYRLIKNIDQLSDEGLNYPLIVKPNCEGSSIGIFNENLVYSKLNLLERVKWLQHQFKQSVLIEEFIDGREFTVSVLGNNPPKVLPIVEQNFEIFLENMPRFASYEAKWFFEDNLPDATKAYHCPAPLTKNLQKKIEEISLKVFSVLNCKDVIRIDYRMDKNENIYLLEVNSLPGLNPNINEVSYLPIAARTAGFSFEGLVNTILNEAVIRYGIIPKKKIYHLLKNYWPQKFLSL